jgi:hypothetical protein
MQKCRACRAKVPSLAGSRDFSARAAQGRQRRVDLDDKEAASTASTCMSRSGLLLDGSAASSWFTFDVSWVGPKQIQNRSRTAPGQSAFAGRNDWTVSRFHTAHAKAPDLRNLR